MKIKKVELITLPEKDLIQGQTVDLEAQLVNEKGLCPEEERRFYTFTWTVHQYGAVVARPTALRGKPWQAQWTPAQPGDYEIQLEVGHVDPKWETLSEVNKIYSRDVVVFPAAKDSLTVTLAPAASDRTNDDVLFQSIRESTRALDFQRYQEFVDRVMCPLNGCLTEPEKLVFNKVNNRRASAFPGVDAYQRLKVATEVYLMLSVRVLGDTKFDGYDADAYKNRHGHSLSLQELQAEWDSYLKRVDGTSMLPIDDLIRSKLKEPIIHAQNGDVTACQGILQQKLQRPCFFELIWSYWHEEGMLAQTMKAIALRFQNQRTSERDPLASFDVSPLHPLSNLLWGYIQDEQHRLTIPRRAYEYDHHYGISLEGKAVPRLRSADSRSKFLEGFHNLLHSALLFFKQDDDTTKRADGFPVLNGLKEVHLLLREGMHNQFGDLPSTARMEMLMEQWILARPEMREFLGGRAMMPYSEDWMDRVDTMKRLKGWSDVSVTYFNELAKFGEQLLISIRHGNWSNIHDAVFASHWAREFRPEIQQYVHAYRTVTAVDLSPGQSDLRLAADRYIQPSVLLRKRLNAQQQQPASTVGFGSPRRADAAAPGRNGGSNGGSNGTSHAAAGRNGVKREEMDIPQEY